MAPLRQAVAHLGEHFARRHRSDPAVPFPLCHTLKRHSRRTIWRKPSPTMLPRIHPAEHSAYTLAVLRELADDRRLLPPPSDPIAKSKIYKRKKRRKKRKRNIILVHRYFSS